MYNYDYNYVFWPRPLQDSPRHVSAPKLLLKQNTLTEDEEITVDMPTGTASLSDNMSSEARPPSTSSVEPDTVVVIEKPTPSPCNSPKLNQRKMRLASRRNSNIPQLRPSSLHEGGGLPPPSSPMFRKVSVSVCVCECLLTNCYCILSRKHTRLFIQSEYNRTIRRWVYTSCTCIHTRMYL